MSTCILVLLEFTMLLQAESDREMRTSYTYVCCYAIQYCHSFTENEYENMLTHFIDSSHKCLSREKYQL